MLRPLERGSDTTSHDHCVEWGAQTIARCFLLRGVEGGYGIADRDQNRLQTVAREARLLASDLWVQAVREHDATVPMMSTAMIFTRLVLDLCAVHRRRD